MINKYQDNQDTIIALSTPSGKGAIAVIRLSGEDAIKITNKVFKGKDLEKQKTHTIHFGTLRNEGTIIDEVLVSLFLNPNSYTGENVVEISCHGSAFIVRKIIQLFQRNSVRYANPGEFTKRAFTNGKLDLAQAEAVADLIASDSEVSHHAALNQMRGGFSKEIKTLREKLINFASLIELELDFSEEDVEFADRSELKSLVTHLQGILGNLIESFDLGNVIKNGVPTVIAGKPNAGKSTLLNALLNEEKAIVSEIPGTTRDFIEDELVIGGVSFRFIDTAGLRHTDDKVEAIGVKRTYEKMKDASLIIYLFDVKETEVSELFDEIKNLEELNIPFLVIANKIDLLEKGELPEEFSNIQHFFGISAGRKLHIDSLKKKLLEVVNLDSFKTGNTVVTNVRHYENLVNTQKALVDVINALENGVSGDFLALDIREALHFLGEITGEITTDDLLANIFSKFCIGK
ncbi:MAG: tRNA uridine-5-carboxymethylaminomethyl(34) synthesis GTPase MnmE [Flammeovirgaceae bacterium]|nr:tRNA uridine-5-carboxymethylaminomethyl(34) synthesis GTPase MnmE [Flammeovirgaceae bacterium]